MVTTYCSHSDVSGILGITVDANSKPSINQVEAMIEMAEAEIDRRTKRTWLTAGKTISNEVHDMTYVYNWGYGVRIDTLYRNHKTLDYAAGDRVQYWAGTGWIDILTSGNPELASANITQDPLNGWIFARGFIFTAVQASRFRVTYRIGETVVPKDIKRCCIFLTVVDILRSAPLFWKALPMGSNMWEVEKMIENYQESIDKIICDYAEISVMI